MVEDVVLKLFLSTVRGKSNKVIIDHPRLVESTDAADTRIDAADTR